MSQRCLAHVASSVVAWVPSKIRRNSSVDRLEVVRPLEHDDVLLQVYLVNTPERPEEFRSPVQIPSIVLQCTSRTPSPSSSREFAPVMAHRGVSPIATGQRVVPVPRRRCTPSPPARWRAGPWRRPTRPTRSDGRPAARAGRSPGRPPRGPVAGRSPRSRGPWPGSPAASAGPPGRCAEPLFSPAFWYISSASVRSSGSGVAVRGGRRAGLDLVPQPEQMLAADPQLAGELRGGLPLGDAAEDQEDRAGLRWVPCQGVPVNMLKTRRQPLQR